MDEPSWDSVYLLGWYDRNDRPFLTTWDGNRPLVAFVVTGVNGMTMPLWRAPVPHGAALHRIPEGKDAADYARELGGFRAVGWELGPGAVARGSR